MSTPIYTCVLLAGLACVSLSQMVDEAAMERAVSHLADKFRSLRTDELGVEVLEDEFQQYPPTLGGVLEEEDIRFLLTNPNLQDALNDVTDVLNAVLAIEQNTTNETVSQCCNSSSSPCCYSCSSNSYSALLVEAESSFSQALNGLVQFQLGLSDGALLVQPSTAPPADEECVELDSRLQPWYVAATADQPRAVAIIVDITADYSMASVIKDAVRNVIKSFSAEDMVGMTLIVGNVQQPTGGLYLANACSKTRLLETFDSLDTLSLMANRRGLLQEYVAKLSTSSITDRILMIVTDANENTTYDFYAWSVQNVSQDIVTANISLQVYLHVDDDIVPQDSPLTGLLDAVSASASNVTDISGYYSHLIRPGNLPTSLRVTTAFTSDGESSLTIFGILWDEGDVVGVVSAQLPNETLMLSINGSLSGRQQSYFFVMDNERTIWYHDRASNVTTHNLSPSLLEPEEAFSDVLDMTMNGAENVIVPVTKMVLLPRTGELEGSYLLQQLPATYNCWKSATVDGTGVSFYTCLLLAQEDTSFVTGWEGVNPNDIYSTTPSREPILHSAVANLTDSSCSYFCYQSISDQVSLQLTSPIETLASDAEITAYINGDGPPPNGIPDGIAEEVAILSSVSDVWVRRAPWRPTSILHRHVATPTGVYMHYPPLSLKDTFMPQELVWYRGAVSQVDALALSPPSEDIVLPVDREVYSASWSLRDDNAQLLAVMAATSTVSSLRVEVDAALDGWCTNSTDVDCMVINDEGFFILNPRDFLQTSYFAEVERYAAIVVSLLEQAQLGNGPVLLQKRGCNDLENGGYNQFYRVNTDNGNVTCGTTLFSHYCIQKIPESNAFLVVVEKIADSSFSLCSKDCFECPDFNPIAASCLCSCSQEMCVPSVIDSDVFTLCPASKAVDPNYMLASTTLYHGNNFCWDSAQCCSLDQGSCESSSTCSWCSESSSCTAIGACCSRDSSCCFDGPSCFVSYCSTSGTSVCPLPSQPVSPSPSPSMEMSNINTEAAIIGGVVGGIFAVFLLALLIVCCVWYQVFRAPVDESHKEKGVFDLTGIRADATNQTAIEITDKPGEPADLPGENGNTVKQDLSAEKNEGTQL